MDRRTFLRGILKTAIIGAVTTPALAELLTPKRTIFLPPAGGWLDNTVDFWKPATPEQILEDIRRMFGKLCEQGYRYAGPNAGVPQFLTNYMDPKMVEVLVTPMRIGTARIWLG